MPRSTRTRRLLTERSRLPRDVLVLGVIAFFVMVGFGVVVPVLPVYVRTFGVGYLEVGAVVSAFALMRFVASPFCGRLIDWLGERALLAIGIGIVAVSSALVGLAGSYLEVLLLRGAGGIGSAMFTVSAMTLLLRSTPADFRGRAVGFYHGGFLLGGMAGPAIGGVLASISLTAPFFFYAATLAVAGIVGLLMLRPKTVEGHDSAAAPAVPLRTVLRDPRFQAACLANLPTAGPRSVCEARSCPCSSWMCSQARPHGQASPSRSRRWCRRSRSGPRAVSWTPSGGGRQFSVPIWSLLPPS